MRPTILGSIVLAMLLPAAFALTARAGGLFTGAATASPTTILVSWGFVEDPAYPTGHPEWTGYDVYRQATLGCGGWVRLNPQPIARNYGVSQEASFLDTTTTPATNYMYRVWMVDANRNEVFLLSPECMWPCGPPAFAMCPALSAPAITGTVTDWGWAVLVSGCTNDCAGGFYLNNPAGDALRPYAGTGTIVAVWGTTYCGTTEGCGMTFDHFETRGTCGATPTRPSTWGQLKSRYR